MNTDINVSNSGIKHTKTGWTCISLVKTSREDKSFPFSGKDGQVGCTNTKGNGYLRRRSRYSSGDVFYSTGIYFLKVKNDEDSVGTTWGSKCGTPCSFTLFESHWDISPNVKRVSSSSTLLNRISLTSSEGFTVGCRKLNKVTKDWCQISTLGRVTVNYNVGLG